MAVQPNHASLSGLTGSFWFELAIARQLSVRCSVGAWDGRKQIGITQCFHIAWINLFAECCTVRNEKRHHVVVVSVARVLNLKYKYALELFCYITTYNIYL